MQNFLRFAFAYLCFAIVVVFVFRDKGMSLLGQMAFSSQVFIQMLDEFAIGLGLAVIVTTVFVGPKVMRARIGTVIVALVA